MSSYNTYEPRNTGRFNRWKHYEVGDELAPGGPVGFGRGNRGYNNEVNNQYRHIQRQYEQQMEEPLRQLEHSSPLMSLRQPVSPPQRSLFQEDQISPFQLLLSSPQEDKFPPVQQLRQPCLQQHTSQEKPTRPVELLHRPKLRQLSPQKPMSPMEQLQQPKLQQFLPQEHIPPMQQLRQPSPQLSPQPRQPSPPQSPLPPHPSPFHCTDSKKNQQSIEEDIEPDKSDSVKKFSDNSNSDYTSVKVKKKLSKREWRRRQNMHLRRILTPKNALNVLNEMLPGEKGISQFKVEPMPPHPYYNASNAHSFCAELTVDGVSYKGYGHSKLTARNDAAEQVVRDLILKHMVKLQQGCEVSPGNVEGQEGKEEEESEEEDDALPMIQLASFALHKLFAEWESDGHKVPQLKALAPPPTSEDCQPNETVSRPRKPRALPTNASTIHPCLLLTYMRSGLEYRELTAPTAGGEHPQNTVYTMGIDVDGRTYVGRGTNKRDARKEAARVACTKHFGVKYADEQPASTTTTATTTATTTTTPAPPV